MSVTVDLDDVDRRILSVLQNDATLTNQELAARMRRGYGLHR